MQVYSQMNLIYSLQYLMISLKNYYKLLLTFLIFLIYIQIIHIFVIFILKNFVFLLQYHPIIPILRDFLHDSPYFYLHIFIEFLISIFKDVYYQFQDQNRLQSFYENGDIFQDTLLMQLDSYNLFIQRFCLQQCNFPYENIYIFLINIYINCHQIMKKSKVFFDLVMDSQPLGKLKFELFYDKTPKTAQNFRALCTGQIKNKLGKVLHYKGSHLHRIIPGFMAQGGDFTHHNGTGGQSIYGNKFNDQNFDIKHTTSGLLSMANAGRNTNGSQFFITFIPTPWLDGNHVVFGKVIQGLPLLKLLQAQGTQSGKPKKSIIIQDCGQVIV